MNIEDVKPGKLVHFKKSGKTYLIVGNRDGSVNWGRKVRLDANGETVWATHNGYKLAEYDDDFTRVSAVQWQVNDKYPEGRTYQASRYLKLTDLTLID